MSASDQNTLMQRIAGELSILSKRIDDAFANIRVSKEILSAARTYYVRTDGSDSNDGLSNVSGGAFLTIQKAIDSAATLDANGNTVIIQVADGTYTGAITLKNVVGYSAVGGLVVQGNNATPSNVIISTTSANCFTADGIRVVWDIKDLKMQTTTSGAAILCQNLSEVRISNVVFGTCAGSHISCFYDSVIYAISNYAISGGATFHWASSFGGFIFAAGITITLTGTPAFSTVFASAAFASIQCNVDTFSGAATGTRYSAALNGIIFTNGGGALYLPGSVGGSTATGGQYV